MGLMDAIESISKITSDPALANAAANIGKAAEKMPLDIAGIRGNTEEMRVSLGGMRTDIGILKVACTHMLDEIRILNALIERLMDPIPRPPFDARDVEAAIKGKWPPSNDNLTAPFATPAAAGCSGASDNEGE